MKTLLISTLALGAVLTLGLPQEAEAAQASSNIQPAVSSGQDSAQIELVKRKGHRGYRGRYYRGGGGGFAVYPVPVYPAPVYSVPVYPAPVYRYQYNPYYYYNPYYNDYYDTGPDFSFRFRIY